MILTYDTIFTEGEIFPPYIQYMLTEIELFF